MEKQISSLGGLWYTYGLVLFIMFAAVARAAIKDIRLAKAAAKAN